MLMSARRFEITATVGLDRAPIPSEHTTVPVRRVERETGLHVKVDISSHLFLTAVSYCIMPNSVGCLVGCALKIQRRPLVQTMWDIFRNIAPATPA